MGIGVAMSRHILRMLLVLIICLGFVLTIGFMRTTIPSFAADPSIALSMKSGPPTITVRITGKGFGANQNILINFDTTPVGTNLADGTGAFTIQIQIPNTATPGNHIIQAISQNSGLSTNKTFLVQTNWSQFGFNMSETRSNPYENVLGTNNASNLVLAWSASVGYAYSSPSVVNGVVYIGSENHHFYAFNATTGVLLWSYTSGDIIDPSAAVVKGVVYIGSADNNMYALNASTGTLIWSSTLGGRIVGSSPTVVNNIVYVGASDDKLYALYAPTGALLWTYTSGAPIGSRPLLPMG